MPLVDAVQDNVEVPEPVTEVGDSVQVKPVEGDAVAVRPTVPLNPFSAVTVMVEVPGVPTVVVTVVGLAVMVKSESAVTWYVTVAV